MAYRGIFKPVIVSILLNMPDNHRLYLQDVIKIILEKQQCYFYDADKKDLGLGDYTYKLFKNKAISLMRSVFDGSDINLKFKREKDAKGYYYTKK